MASPGDTMKTLKKPLVVIKKESLFNPSSPFLMRVLKRPITQAPSTAPSPKKSRSVTVSDVQSTPKVIITNCTAAAEVNTNRPVIATSSLGKVTGGEKSLKEFTTPDLQRIIQSATKKQKFFMFKKQSCAKLQRCTKHDDSLMLHVAEGLPQLWDLYNSVEHFLDYTDEHAKTWFFYYARFDSRNLKSRPHYNSRKPTYYHFECSFNKKHYKSQSKGLRKPREKLAVDCPAGLTLRIAVGHDKCMVWDVCHHHTHELSAEVFSQLSHGKRLPQEIKDEIRDLALFNLQPVIARRYIESKVPDLKLRRTVYNTFRKFKNDNFKETKNMPPERVKEILDKIKYIKANFDEGPQPVKEPECSSSPKCVAKPKEKKKKKEVASTKDSSTNPEKKVKTMSNLSYEQEVIQSVEELQKSSCVTQVNPWLETVPVEYESDADGDDDQFEDSKYETDNSDTETPTTDVNPLIKPSVIIEEDSEPVTTTRILKYKIGDITIETGKSPTNSEISTVVLQGGKSNPNVSQRRLIAQLYKLEQSIDEPKQELITKKVQQKGIQKVRILPPKSRYETPEVRCQRRHKNLPEHKAEGLVQAGDTFSSISEFIRYTASHAQKWFFYYKINDSRNAQTSPRYDKNLKTLYYFSCRFDNKCYRSRGTGKRKVKPKTTICPASVTILCRPGDDKFRVMYACHHHSHELSEVVFGQQAHGHRLTQDVKDEISALAWFGLDTRLIRIYLQKKTGYDNLNLTIKNHISKMKRENRQLYLSPEKQREVLEKIKEIKQNFPIPKRASPKKKIRQEVEQNKIVKRNIPILKRASSTKKKQERKTRSNESDDEENKSRVDIRLKNILYDQDLIQSVKELQESTGCEIRIDQCGDEHVDEGNVDLQAGIIENTEYELQEEGDVNESQIEIDQQLYSLDDSVHYIIDDGTFITYEADNTAENPENICEEQIVEHCDANVQEPPNNYEVTITYEEGNTLLCDGKMYYKVEPEKEDEPVEPYHEADECSDNENEYQNTNQYNNDEDFNVENSENSGHMSNVQRIKEAKDIGVQADFEIIELEKDCERIKKLESITLSKDISESNLSVNTRGRPKVVLEEGIINRFNIEFYISVGGIIPCLENLANSMNVSVLDLLKKLYQGEAVFQMSLGRSGKLDRKTIQLTYTPLTIAFPFEKFKYMNGLQEYKTMCSKYADVVIKLEDTVESMSTELKDTKEKLSTLELQNAEFLKAMKNYEQSVKTHNQSQEMITKCQEDLKLTEAENKALIKKVSKLEALQLTSRLKDADLLKQLLQPALEEEELNTLKTENESLREKLYNKQKPNSKLIEKNKKLEQTVETLQAEIRGYTEKIRKLEELYLTDSQSLLDKIKGLKEELDLLRTKNRSVAILKLRKKIKEIEEVRLSEKKMYTVKIKKLCETVSSLNKQLNSRNRRNSLDEDSCTSFTADSVA